MLENRFIISKIHKMSQYLMYGDLAGYPVVFCFTYDLHEVR